MTGRELESQSILEISAIEKLKTVSDQADRLKFVVEFVGEQSEIIAGKDAPTPEALSGLRETLRPGPVLAVLNKAQDLSMICCS